MNRLPKPISPRTAMLLTVAGLLLPLGPAFAHDGAGSHAFSLAAGFTHPLSGLDHLLAMLAVGLWAVRFQGSQRRAIPAGFLCGMLAGAALGMSGIALPGLEPGIAVSVALLGLLASITLRLPGWAGIGLALGFGLLHGAPHGLEIPATASALPYVLGMLAATAALLTAGIAGGVVLRNRLSDLAPRMAGGLIAVAGVAMLTFAG